MAPFRFCIDVAVESRRYLKVGVLSKACSLCLHDDFQNGVPHKIGGTLRQCNVDSTHLQSATKRIERALYSWRSGRGLLCELVLQFGGSGFCITAVINRTMVYGDRISLW